MRSEINKNVHQFQRTSGFKTKTSNVGTPFCTWPLFKGIIESFDPQTQKQYCNT